MGERCGPGRTGRQVPADLDGRYQLIGELGRGGFGVVFRAYDQQLAREVAVKLLADRYAADPRDLRRFRDEAIAVARLNHRSIVTLYDFPRSPPEPYMVMELVTGRSLSRGGYARPGRRTRLATGLDGPLGEAAARDLDRFERALAPATGVPVGQLADLVAGWAGACLRRSSALPEACAALPHLVNRMGT
ncbi:protein kinase [Kitasatospora sp. GP82]|uniref:protein kinase domain-containing protein n=1 Tax=Kitasatospora sp. GP82 TaxID=3035089 RepID=UPI002475DE4A|nr:protein kinase [Kitasatospora sp. GP82]MDH6123373.1 hypothetical protein [Kitasatospora sp. GP82]